MRVLRPTRSGAFAREEKTAWLMLREVALCYVLGRGTRIGIAILDEVSNAGKVRKRSEGIGNP